MFPSDDLTPDELAIIDCLKKKDIIINDRYDPRLEILDKLCEKEICGWEFGEDNHKRPYTIYYLE